MIVIVNCGDISGTCAAAVNKYIHLIIVAKPSFLSLHFTNARNLNIYFHNPQQRALLLGVPRGELWLRMTDEPSFFADGSC